MNSENKNIDALPADGYEELKLVNLERKFNLLDNSYNCNIAWKVYEFNLQNLFKI